MQFKSQKIVGILMRTTVKALLMHCNGMFSIKCGFCTCARKMSQGVQLMLFFPFTSRNIFILQDQKIPTLLTFTLRT